MPSPQAGVQAQHPEMVHFFDLFSSDLAAVLDLRLLQAILVAFVESLLHLVAELLHLIIEDLLVLLSPSSLEENIGTGSANCQATSSTDGNMFDSFLIHLYLLSGGPQRTAHTCRISTR